MWGGDACVALVLSACALFPSRQGDASVPTPLRTAPAPTATSPVCVCTFPLPPGRRERPHSTPHHSRPYGYESCLRVHFSPPARATQASPLHSAPLPPLRLRVLSVCALFPSRQGDASVPTPLRTAPAPTATSPVCVCTFPLPPGRRKRPHSTPHRSRPYGYESCLCVHFPPSRQGDASVPTPLRTAPVPTATSPVCVCTFPPPRQGDASVPTPLRTAPAPTATGLLFPSNSIPL